MSMRLVFVGISVCTALFAGSAFAGPEEDEIGQSLARTGRPVAQEGLRIGVVGNVGKLNPELHLSVWRYSAITPEQVATYAASRLLGPGTKPAGSLGETIVRINGSQGLYEPVHPGTIPFEAADFKLEGLTASLLEADWVVKEAGIVRLEGQAYAVTQLKLPLAALWRLSTPKPQVPTTDGWEPIIVQTEETARRLARERLERGMLAMSDWLDRVARSISGPRTPAGRGWALVAQAQAQWVIQANSLGRELERVFPRGAEGLGGLVAQSTRAAQDLSEALTAVGYNRENSTYEMLVDRLVQKGSQRPVENISGLVLVDTINHADSRVASIARLGFSEFKGYVVQAVQPLRLEPTATRSAEGRLLTQMVDTTTDLLDPAFLKCIDGVEWNILDIAAHSAQELFSSGKIPNSLRERLGDVQGLRDILIQLQLRAGREGLFAEHLTEHPGSGTRNLAWVLVTDAIAETEGRLGVAAIKPGEIVSLASRRAVPIEDVYRLTRLLPEEVITVFRGLRAAARAAGR